MLGIEYYFMLKVIICRKQVDDVQILSLRYFKVPACYDTFTKSTGVKNHDTKVSCYDHILVNYFKLFGT